VRRFAALANRRIEEEGAIAGALSASAPLLDEKAPRRGENTSSKARGDPRQASKPPPPRRGSADAALSADARAGRETA
jgi:hypothetical protein